MKTKPRAEAKGGRSGLAVDRRGETIRDLETLKEYPFLKAALEDLDELQRSASRKTANRRHVVSLMFDALEFILYEILLLYERDIYKTGQNTIGFDEALSVCEQLGVDVPLIGTVRQIQKHRGDDISLPPTPHLGDMCAGLA